jgi:hypothetical protein
LTEASAAVDDDRGRARTAAPGSDPIARLVFALLVIACFAAFLITQRLKHSPTAVQEFDVTPYFSPYPSGQFKQARISFKLAEPNDVTVTIIDSSGNTVATLVREHPLAGYRQLSLRWNGRRGTAHRYSTVRTPAGLIALIPENTGAIAPAGVYRVRVELRHHSPVLSTRSLTLVAP